MTTCKDALALAGEKHRAALHDVDKSRLKFAEAKSLAEPAAAPQITLDEGTMAHLAMLQETLTGAGQAISWNTCDPLEVAALKSVIQQASVIASKKDSAAAPAPTETVGNAAFVAPMTPDRVLRMVQLHLRSDRPPCLLQSTTVPFWKDLSRRARRGRCGKLIQ